MDGGRPNSCAGFVLTGGQSSRMGRDKALLELEGATLVERIAGCVRDAAGNVTLVGAPERYSGLGYAVLPDLVENVGPMGGILTALWHSGSEWNLVVACDMPNVNGGFLRQLLDEALARDVSCLVPETSDGVHPLCAVYHRRVLPALQQAIDHKFLKMQDFLKSIGAERWPVADSGLLQNVNTPAEWMAR